MKRRIIAGITAIALIITGIWWITSKDSRTQHADAVRAKTT